MEDILKYNSVNKGFALEKLLTEKMEEKGWSYRGNQNEKHWIDYLFTRNIKDKVYGVKATVNVKDVEFGDLDIECFIGAFIDSAERQLKDNSK